MPRPTGPRATLLLALAALLAGCAQSAGSPPSSWVDGIDPASFEGFALYSPGETFDGQELQVASQNVSPPSPGSPIGAWINQVNFIYGTCSPPPAEGGCAPPVSVQISPACETNFSLYRRFPAPDGTIAIRYEPVRIGAVPGIDVDEGDGGHRLELYTGRVTIRIWELVHDDRRFELARALQPQNALARRAALSRGGLPPPVAGAMEGRLTCSAAERS